MQQLRVDRRPQHQRGVERTAHLVAANREVARKVHPVARHPRARAASTRRPGLLEPMRPEALEVSAEPEARPVALEVSAEPEALEVSAARPEPLRPRPMNEHRGATGCGRSTRLHPTSGPWNRPADPRTSLLPDYLIQSLSFPFRVPSWRATAACIAPNEPPLIPMRLHGTRQVAL